MLAAPRLDDLLARLPGTVRRGHAPAARAGEAECLPTGIAELDRAIGGGFPRGRLSEILGRGSAGATSILHRLAARATAAGDLVAWIDTPDAFDPESAAASGIALDRFLWTRPRDVLGAFAATEQILVLGGFALVVLDVDAADGMRPRSASVAPDDATDGDDVVPWAAGNGRAHASRVGPRWRRGTLWLRLARAAARSQSALVARGCGSEGAGSSAAVRLELPPAAVRWERSGHAPALLEGLHTRIVVKRNRGHAGERAIAVVLG